jgi:hypothetical protein
VTILNVLKVNVNYEVVATIGRDGWEREMKERSGKGGRWEWRPRGLLFVGVWKWKWLWLVLVREMALAGSGEGNGGKTEIAERG